MLDKRKEKANFGFIFRGGGGGGGLGEPYLFWRDIYIYAIHVPLLKLHKIDTYFSSWDKSR